eukprot:TRINITY_DN7584_c0_g1_i2.p3 TRINITY_DN7584_c0_g1~~TRINITY_DN7584_c0_g1_i2.p3  ORF type:complete len:123 (-),score=23.22 TRINITY_DN7584_c0_g1_i2:48-416(-)
MYCLFFFSSRRRHTRFLPVSWARRCVQETVIFPAQRDYIQSIQVYQQVANKQQNPINTHHIFFLINVQEKLNKILIMFLHYLDQPMYSASVSYTHLTLPTKRIVQISVVAVSFKKKRKHANV